MTGAGSHSAAVMFFSYGLAAAVEMNLDRSLFYVAAASQILRALQRFCIDCALQ